MPACPRVERVTTADPGKPWFLAVAPKAPHVAAAPAPWYRRGTFVDALRAPRGGSYNASKAQLAEHHWLISQQGPITQAQEVAIDELFRDRWRALLSVDDAVVGRDGKYSRDPVFMLQNTNNTCILA